MKTDKATRARLKQIRPFLLRKFVLLNIDELKPLMLSQQEMDAMEVFWTLDAQLTSKELAGLMSITIQSASRVLLSLSRKGYLTRVDINDSNQIKYLYKINKD